MTKYIAYHSGSDTPFVFIPDEDCKTFWLKKEPNLLFISINDSDYVDAKWKRMRIENNSWSWEDVGDHNNNPIISRSISEDELNTRLDDFKNKAKLFLTQNANLPSHYDNGLDAINALSSSGITFPVNAKNWVKACIDNGITIPFINEIH